MQNKWWKMCTYIWNDADSWEICFTYSWDVDIHWTHPPPHIQTEQWGGSMIINLHAIVVSIRQKNRNKTNKNTHSP